MKVASPTAWTTLELSIHTDGTSVGKLTGATLSARRIQLGARFTF